MLGPVLSKDFYLRDPAVVASELLGKMLIRILDSELVGGMIVETEAYYGVDDPASKAYQGKLTKISRVMYKEGGITLIYMVHGNWLFNIVTGPKDVPSGVLIRAIEPKIGIKLMLRNRNVNDLRELTSGPGKLSQALKIDKSLNMLPVYDPNSPIRIHAYKNIPSNMIERSGRIGVREDLSIPLRFYIKDNRYISKK